MPALITKLRLADPQLSLLVVDTANE